MDSYDEMNRVLITDDVDTQCVDMLIANGFSVEKDIKLAKQPQEQLIKKVQVKFFSRSNSEILYIGGRYLNRSKCNKSNKCGY